MLNINIKTLKVGDYESLIWIVIRFILQNES